MKKIKTAAAISVATGLLLGMSGCGAPKDTYRDFLDLQAAAVSAGFPCSGAELQTGPDGRMGATCSDNSHISLGPGKTTEEMWDIKRDGIVLALGPMDEEALSGNEDQRSLMLIGPGFAVSGSTDSQSQFEAMAKKGGDLKKLSMRHFYDVDTPWSKMKSAD